MFRYSVWYQLKDSNHEFSNLVKHYAKINGNLLVFHPHITIRHTLSYQEGLSFAKLFEENYLLPRIRTLPTVKVSKTSVRNANGKAVLFYALEQPVVVNNERIEGLHMSLAYKVNNAFTVAEMNNVKPYQGTFKPEDFEVALYSCHDKIPARWRRV